MISDSPTQEYEVTIRAASVHLVSRSFTPSTFNLRYPSRLFEQVITILAAMLGVAAFLVLGALLRWLRILRPAFDRSLLKLIIRGLMPAFIVGLIAGNEKLREPMRVIQPPLVGFFSIVLGFGVAAVAVRPVRSRQSMSLAAQRTFIFTVGIQNYGYIAAPIVALLFGTESLAVLFLHNVGVDLAFWTVGVLVMTGHFSRQTLIRAINPPSIAIILALTANWSGFAPHIPIELIDALRIVGQASIPLGLILIGATAFDHLHEARIRESLPMVFAANGLRLGLIPLCILLIAIVLPGSAELKKVMIVQAAMPSGVFAIIMAKQYHGDTPTAMRIILTTNIICLITTPIWLPIGMALVGVTR